IVVCPDNGLITWAFRLSNPNPTRFYELTWRPAQSSNTFHGRDVMAPVAGRLAAGERISHLAKSINDPILLDIEPSNAPNGRIIHLDTFGNATTNIPYEIIRGQAFKDIKVRGKRLGRLRKTYADVAPGKPLALIGSCGLLEIAVRDGDAARQLKL